MCVYVVWYIYHNMLKFMYKTERNETDILRDIIADMQEEIDVLKKNQKAGPAIAIWQTSKSNSCKDMYVID